MLKGIGSAFLFYPKDPTLDSRNTRDKRDKNNPNSSNALNNVLSTLSLGSNPVTVVGVIGKSRAGKAWLCNSLLDKPIFKVLLDMEDPTDKQSRSSQNQCCIEMYHDAESNLIYLHLVSLEDHTVLSNMCRGLNANMSQTEFHLWLEKQEYHYLKALFFMFLSCHIILVSHPDHNFDISYLRIFRILSTMKNLVSENILNYLSNTLRSQESVKFTSPFCPGRCVPILSFVFNDHYLSHIKNSYQDTSNTKSKYVRYNPMVNARAKIQTSLENQVKDLFKTANHDKNASNSSNSSNSSDSQYVLYTLDPNHAVHVVSIPSQANSMNALFDDEDDIMDDTNQNSTSSTSPSSSSSSSSDGIAALRQWIITKSKLLQAQSVSPSPVINNSSRRENNSSQSSTVGSGSGASSSTLLSSNPNGQTSRSWFLSALVLQDLFLYGRKILGGRGNKGDLMEKIKAFLDADYKFSTSRCRDVMSAAREEYFRDLPEFYTTSFHEKKLSRVYAVFASIALGPAQSHYWSRIVEECTMYWKNGHQMCDETSLTGRPCIHRRHQTLEEAKGTDDKKSITSTSSSSSTSSTRESKSDRLLPIQDHSSGVRTLHACNCGKTRTLREDPFSIEVANKTFYERDCCHPHSLSYITIPQNRFLDPPPNTYLCSFPYWSLVKLGSSRDYNLSGMTQDGFLAGNNLLLPWEIPTSKISVESEYPSKTNQTSSRGGESGSLSRQDIDKKSKNYRRGKERGGKRVKVQQESSRGATLGSYFDEVRKEKTGCKTVYVGFEYECQNGQRFLLNTEIIKTAFSHSNFIKMGKVDVGRVLSIGGIPLFVKSPQPPNAIGQLQRIYIVTPKYTSETSDSLTQTTTSGNSSELPEVALVINPVVEFARKVDDIERAPRPIPIDQEQSINSDDTSSNHSTYSDTHHHHHHKRNVSKSSFTEQKSNFLFVLSEQVVLPWDSFLCLRLPYVYPKPDGKSLGHPDQAGYPYVAMLLDNSIQVIRNIT
eukprot:TRINITY_DN3760_c0_g1_i1.p1 TRINITY_DN3760_c0_g1~~TRINITY_DN3760_c0_g1_i1.p1  ORF type:complete len:996 (-),score=198.72 TRINITY_DN3760_c0_g1_i1:216-3203(-)